MNVDTVSTYPGECQIWFVRFTVDTVAVGSPKNINEGVLSR